MEMKEIVSQINFMLGFPANENIEGLQVEQAVLIAFQELKRYMRTPVDKTVPYQTRIKLPDVGVYTKRVLSVKAAVPRIGLTMSSIDSGNVFQVAASVNVYSAIGNTAAINIDPVMSEAAMAQLRNTLSTDFQWRYDQLNQVIYIAHRDPRPATVTIQYVPDFKDVSEIVDDTWINYLIRLSTANMKLALGRTRSKYTIEGSNVTLDGEILLNEANEEIREIREELDKKIKRMVIVN